MLDRKSLYYSIDFLFSVCAIRFSEISSSDQCNVELVDTAVKVYQDKCTQTSNSFFNEESDQDAVTCEGDEDTSQLNSNTMYFYLITIVLINFKMMDQIDFVMMIVIRQVQLKFKTMKKYLNLNLIYFIMNMTLNDLPMPLNLQLC